jgi:MinD-like ATPase involved in chromosome partitioning or flagellar assembly
MDPRDTPPEDDAAPRWGGEPRRLAADVPPWERQESRAQRPPAPPEPAASPRPLGPPPVSHGRPQGFPHAPPQRPDLAGAVQPSAQWQPAERPEHTGPIGMSYQIETESLIRTRKQPPEMGWRKFVYDASFKTINPGQSPFEQRLNAQKRLIAGNIPRTYQIAFISVKGGVGKTRTTAGVGTVFAKFRTEPVIAIDANPTYGSLGSVIDPSTVASVRDWISDDQLTTYPMARRHTGKNHEGLEVLAGNQNVANPLALDADVFNSALARAQQFYQLSLIDCGCDIDHPVMQGVLSSASALVIVSTMQAEHARAAGQTIQWLAARNGEDLLRRTVVVLNDAFRGGSKEFVANISEQFAPYVQAVKVVPWDSHLRDALTLDFEALGRRTQLAYIDVAAELASRFEDASTP